MKVLYEEIMGIPEHAARCYEKNKGLVLPTGVPYLGMGASSHAPLTLYYCGADILPGIASEYYRYRSRAICPIGVLISQSGETSETLWSAERFTHIIAVTNNPASSLAASPKTERVVPLMAGEEQFLSSTKTYINILIALYLGLGIDPGAGIAALKKHFAAIEEKARANAERIHTIFTTQLPRGLYILGSGPNAATAMQAALILTETARLPWIGTSLGQFDHGPKEAARNALVLFLDGNGKDKSRTDAMEKTLKEKTGAFVVRIAEKNLPEELTPLTLIAHVDFLMNYLADALGVGAQPLVGNKITRVPDEVK